MPPRKKRAKYDAAATGDKAVEAYQFTRDEATRKNNPEAGFAVHDRADREQKHYKYDPHLDPQLIWAGKEERDETGFQVDTVSLHIHERVSAPQIIAQAKRDEPKQLELFADPHLPLSEAIDFYKHDVDWSNRMILGDSLLVMNSLLEREAMAGKVQLVYVDPPYGIAYNSNFQPATNRRDVKDGDDGSLTREMETIKAYNDTWRLKVHSYLTYLRDRLKLARELLADTGSIVVQISDDNLHYVRQIMDEIFNAGSDDNFVALIPFRKKTMPFGTTFIEQMDDFLLWYTKDRAAAAGKYHALFREQAATPDADWCWYQLPDGRRGQLTREQIRSGQLPADARIYRLKSIEPSGSNAGGSFDFELEGRTFKPPKQGYGTGPDGMKRLAAAGRLQPKGELINYVLFHDDYPVTALTSPWNDTVGPQDKKYVVQTSDEIVKRCILMTTDPGDLVLDPTCGSGTTAYVAEQWGRRWITCDTSRVALNLARQRLLTASFPYYKLGWPDAGVSGGFDHETATHITLRSIAQDTRLDAATTREECEQIIREDAKTEPLHDQPKIERNKVRVSGPFTVEAIPVPALQAQEDSPIAGFPDPSTGQGGPRDLSAADYLDTLTALLRRDGVTFPGGRKLELRGLRATTRGGFVHAEAETETDGKSQRIAISFGPQYGPVSLQQIEQTARQARLYDLLIFAGFSFDAAAQAFLQENRDPSLKMELAHIRPDVQLGDLLKVTANSQLFSVFGQPDVHVAKTGDSFTAEIRGVDIYDPSTGDVHSEEGKNVAAWFLDQDYDGRTFGICQAFFPGDQDAWKKLQRALKGVIDEERFEAMRGTVSLPFPAGEHRTIAVKVIDFRGNEVIRIVRLDDVRG